MASENSLQQAQALMDELIEAARKGAIIPIRLPGQLEAIRDLLTQAQDEQMQMAQQAAAPADMEEFLKEQAYVMSHAVHELRTPMTSIRGYADMLGSPAMGELNDMQKQFIETIRTNSKRMEGLLTDVSNISKIRGGTLKVNPKMDMFKNIAMMVEKQVTPLAEQLQRKFTLDIPQGLPILETDSDHLTTALVKLVENGLRYNERDDAEVILGAVGEGKKLTITVRDNGIGMTPEELEQLGTIYYRGTNEVVLSYKGSGLGIPVAYGIVKLLNGTIAVESTPQVGTTFTITLMGMG